MDALIEFIAKHWFLILMVILGFSFIAVGTIFGVNEIKFRQERRKYLRSYR